MRSRPHPFVPLHPNKMVLPQGLLPPNATFKYTGCSRCHRSGQGAGRCLFQLWTKRTFRSESTTRDQARKPNGAQPHVEEVVKATMEEHAEGVAERCSGVQFCVNCGMVDHVASQCKEDPVSDDLAFSRWAATEDPSMAAQDAPASGDHRVLVLRLADLPAMIPPPSLSLLGVCKCKLAWSRRHSTHKAERS